MSFSPEVLARISQLNRQLGDAPQPIAAKSRLAGNSSTIEPPTLAASVETEPSANPAIRDSRLETTEQQTRRLPNGVVVETASGECYRIQSPLEQLWRGSERMVRRDGDLLRICVDSQENPHPELSALAQAFPSKVMFLDLETCGFAGAVIFLIGLLHVEDGQWRLTQWLARNYAEEKAILHAMWRTAQQAEVLVTYNGKSFDWPCVHDRSTLHHLGRQTKSEDADGAAVELQQAMERRQSRPFLTHCDLLHHARRKWRATLPNCKLQTIERHLFGRRRRDDIPGSEIPAAYHQYVRSGDAWEMRSVLHHNALDLITLLQIALKIAE